MKVIKTIQFQTSMLLSTNATETVAAWVAGTNYPKDAEVNYLNSIYVSLQAANLGKTPDTEPTWWLRKSANNSYSMFDEFVNTRTVKASPLTVQVKPGGIFNSVAFFNLVGVKTIALSITDGVGMPEVYSQSFDLDDTVIIDWYMYFFEPYDLRTDFVVLELPPHINGVINCTFSGDTTQEVGNMVFGNLYEIGKTQYGATLGIRDYSSKNTNAFGITTFTQRAFSKRMEANVYVENSNLRYVQKLLEEVRAVPSVWIGSSEQGYDVLNVYGYYRDFNIEIPYPNNSFCRLEIEGLI